VGDLKLIYKFLYNKTK